MCVFLKRHFPALKLKLLKDKNECLINVNFHTGKQVLVMCTDHVKRQVFGPYQMIVHRTHIINVI